MYPLRSQRARAKTNQTIRRIGQVQLRLDVVIREREPQRFDGNRCYFTAQQALTECHVLADRQFAQDPIAFLANRHRHYARHSGGGRSRPFGVCEDVQVGIRHRFDKLPRFLEKLGRLTRESGHDIRADGRIGHQLPRLCQPVCVVPRPVFPMHAPQDGVRP